MRMQYLANAWALMEWVNITAMETHWQRSFVPEPMCYYLSPTRPLNTCDVTEQQGQDIADHKAPAGSKALTAVFNQINFVMCKVEAKPLLQDSLSYGAADLNSDHKPVVTHLQMNWMCLLHKHHPKQGGRVMHDLRRRACDTVTQASYKKTLRGLDG